MEENTSADVNRLNTDIYRHHHHHHDSETSTTTHCSRHCPHCHGGSTHQRRSNENAIIQCILEQQAQCYDHIFQQHHDIRQLKEYVRKFHDLIKTVDDALDIIVQGIVDIQRRLENMNNNTTDTLLE
ncbi:unnamed protein product [Adineta ricciae]|nr:unnamed protein product [Adineta ricciae]